MPAWAPVERPRTDCGTDFAVEDAVPVGVFDSVADVEMIEEYEDD